MRHEICGVENEKADLKSNTLRAERKRWLVFGKEREAFRCERYQTYGELMKHISTNPPDLKVFKTRRNVLGRGFQTLSKFEPEGSDCTRESIEARAKTVTPVLEEILNNRPCSGWDQ